jgi:AraC family transcriptional regulator, transcriptional activator of pobA
MVPLVSIMARDIPVYDICTIESKGVYKDLLVERFATYLDKHYQDLHRPHRHSFYHLVLFVSGTGTHSIDFSNFKVKPYQVYFMIPGQVHSWHFEKKVDGFIVHFNEALFSSFLLDRHYLEKFPFFQGISEEGIVQLPVEIHGRVTAIFESLLEEVANQKLHSLDMIRLRLLEFFNVVARSGTGGRQKSIPPQKQLLLRSFRQLIDQNFRNSRLPKDYAGLLYITPNHLNALCQDLVGKTAGELIRDRVLLEAKRLLTNAGMTVSEVAYDLQFQDNSYFNRFFKKETGITPEEFRKSFDNQSK